MAFMHNAADQSRRWYQKLVKAGHSAAGCLQGGDCESVCAQKLEIIEWLPKVHAYMTETSV